MTPDDLAQELLDLTLDADPVAASLLGVPGRDDRLADLGAQAEEAAAAAYDDLARRAEALDVEGLSETDRQTRDMVALSAATGRDVARLGAVEWTVTDLYIAPAPALTEMVPQVPLHTAERARGYLARLGAVGDHLDQAAQRHRTGIAAGRTPVAHLVRAAVEHLDRVLADPDLAGLRVDPGAVEALPSDFAAERDRLLADAVRPALARYRAALQDDVLPAGRDEEHVGLCWLPDGDAAYATFARQHTSTDRDAADLHATGLAIVAGLEEEYAEVGGRAFGLTTPAEIFARLRTDPALRYGSAQEMLDQAHGAITRAEASAPRWFGRLPAQSCRLEPVPAAAEPGAPPAYYLPGAVDGSRSGTYFLNTSSPGERALYNAECVAFHEAVPGHHLQVSIAQEHQDLPLARRLLGDTAFTEGWGLYCERLADEMGLYSDDVARLGMLAADSWRAARLVVDTGIHALGWSRAQAVAWMGENTPLGALETATEIDRYIAYPGQALSYMVGRIELTAIRRRAEERLGEHFALPAFHDLVLSGGALPLPVLAGVVDRWAETVAA